MSALTPEQRDAVSSRVIDVLCEAGAGTGKTTVLVQRFVAAVCDDGVEIGAILAFTFTERAADQLRGRIRGALRTRAREAGEAGEEERRLELERMARDTEAANISTIHGFCRRLLAANPAAAGVDPRFRVLDAGEAARLQSHAFTAALDEILSDSDPEAAGRVVAAVQPDSLRTIVTTAYDELRSRGHDEPRLPAIAPTDPSAALEQVASAASAASGECEAAKKPSPQMIERLRRAAELHGADGTEGLLDAVIGLELSSTAQAFKGEACERYRKAWAKARRALAEVEMAEAYDLLQDLLVAYGARYEELKRARSGLDFEDLQLRAVAVLRESDQVRSSYADGFRHILVDEFQDTNPVQRDLVRLLQGDDTRLFCVGDELQSIYGFRHADVGVFRAERERFAQMPDDKGRVLPLTGNFRARPDLLGAVNAFGEALIGTGYAPLSVGREPEAKAPPGPDVELLLTANGRNQDWSAEEVGLDLDEDEPAPAARVAEARGLAQRLAELHLEGVERSSMVVLLRSFGGVDAYERALRDAGLEPYVVGGRGYWSQQQVEDVLALLGVIANPLDDEAVLGSLASPACAVTPDTLWLLRRIALDRAARERSARYWPTLREALAREIPAESDGARALEAIDPAELDRLRRFHMGIERLREDAPLLGLQGLIEETCERLGYDLATLMRPDGAKRWANVRKLMRLAAEFEANEGAELRGFLQYAADETARAAEGEAPIAAERHDGVRIMTVHAAKGLEFDVVAVPELGRRLLAGFAPAIRLGTVEPAGDASANGAGESDEDEAASPVRIGLRLARLGRPSEDLFELDELKEEAEQEESAEELRLAHVAATRAERKLVLSGTFSPGVEPASELKAGAPVTERLLRAFGSGELGDLIAGETSGSAEIPVPAPHPRPGLDARFEPSAVAVRVRFPEEGAGAALAPPPLPSRTEPEPEGSAEPPLLELPPPPASAARLSYSALSLYGRCGYRFFVERELGLGDAGDAVVLSTAAARDEGAAAERDPAAAADGDELLAPGELEDAAAPSARAARFGFGNAVHRLLEWSARNRWAEPGAERCARVLRAEGLSSDEAGVARATGMVRAWLESDLCERLRGEGVVLRPEQSFLLPLGGALIRGSVDLLAELPDGETVIVDYKTDNLGGDLPADHIGRYDVQRSIYALATARKPVLSVYSFLERTDLPEEKLFGEAELAQASERIRGLLAGIAAGRFDVTRHPHAALCADCPARRLCSHRSEDQLRRSPEPPVDPEGRLPPTPGDASSAPADSARDGGPQLSLLGE